MAPAPNMSKRFFLRGDVSQSSQNTHASIRPPWAISETSFLEFCSRCNECIIDCPQGIIKRGDGGFPEISFKQGECTFCASCASACKTGALDASLISNQNKQQKAWDLEVSIQSKCLSLNAVVCRTCSDNCEAQAIRFQLKLGGVSKPLISAQDCTGCGACVAVCPVDAVQIKPILSKSIAA